MHSVATLAGKRFRIGAVRRRPSILATGGSKTNHPRPVGAGAASDGLIARGAGKPHDGTVGGRAAIIVAQRNLLARAAAALGAAPIERPLHFPEGSNAQSVARFASRPPRNLEEQIAADCDANRPEDEGITDVGHRIRSARNGTIPRAVASPVAAICRKHPRHHRRQKSKWTIRGMLQQERLKSDVS